MSSSGLFIGDVCGQQEFIACLHGLATLCRPKSNKNEWVLA